MTHTRIASALLAAMVPFSAIAADVSAADVIGAVLSEQRPETIFLKTTKEMDGATTVVTVTGAREGGIAGKMWTRTSVDWKRGASWMKVESEMRLKDARAYMMIKKASASSDVPAALEFSAAAGKWFELDLNDPAVKGWFMSDADAGVIGSLFSLNRTRYQGGYSNTMTLTGTEADLTMVLRNALPALLAPTSLAGATMKIDTNSVGAFQFASLKSSAFEARVQRQIGAVYVETPKGTMSRLPMGQISSMYFSPMSGSEVKPVAAVSSPSAVNHDVGTEMKLPSLSRNPVTAGVVKRTSERALIDLVGPDGVNVKRTVRLALTQVQWDSLAAFRFDFSRDGGILYMYPNETKPVFTTRDAYAPLDVIFFDKNGSYVSSERMRKCESSVCPEFSPPVPVKYALQVEEGFTIKHKVGPLWRLDISWYKLPQSLTLSPQQIDRMARRNILQRQGIKLTPTGDVIGETGYESLRTLAKVLASKVRSADIASMSGLQPNEKVSMSVYTLLWDTVKSNPEVTYAYVVRPTDIPNAFALLVDNFTYATKDVLDLDKNGRVESTEEPAKVGTLYRYPSLSEALMKSTFIDISDNGDVTALAPVRDQDGNVVALVAVMQPMRR